MRYDLIIAGAGPAGLSAAIRARQLSLTCAVIEKESEEYYKPCGDGLTVRAIRALEPLGVSLDDLYQAGAQEIRTSIHNHPHRTDCLPHRPGTMVTLSRPRLLSLLRDRACAAGAVFLYCFHEPFAIGDEGVTAGSLHASALIDAGGARYTLPGGNVSASRLPAGMSGLVHAPAPLIGDRDLRFIHCLDDPHGYCWAFPLSGSLWNVGIWRTRNLAQLREEFDAFINGWLKEHLGTFEWTAPPRGALLGTRPGAVYRSPLAMTCGDAAGACNIQSGEGISFAVAGACCAVDLLAFRLGMCSRETVCESAFLQEACPEPVESAVPFCEDASGAPVFLLRTASGSYAASCRDGRTGLKRLTAEELKAVDSQ